MEGVAWAKLDAMRGDDHEDTVDLLERSPGKVARRTAHGFGPFALRSLKGTLGVPEELCRGGQGAYWTQKPDSPGEVPVRESTTPSRCGPQSPQRTGWARLFRR
jgi:hypothetical protein